MSHLARLPTNDEILAARTAARERIAGPRVGDFLRLPRIDPRQPEFTRFTHHWDHPEAPEKSTMQTGGSRHGRYYFFDSGELSYSGGLHPGIPVSALIPTADTMPGSVWFFDRNESGPGRGVDFEVPCRIYDLAPGTDTSRLYELHVPYRCRYQPDGGSYGYRYVTTHHGGPHKGFRTLEELQAWAAAENYALVPLEDGNYRIAWPAAA